MFTNDQQGYQLRYPIGQNAKYRTIHRQIWHYTAKLACLAENMAAFGLFGRKHGGVWLFGLKDGGTCLRCLKIGNNVRAGSKSFISEQTL